MKFFQTTNCCGCTDLRTGGLIIGYLLLVFDSSCITILGLHWIAFSPELVATIPLLFGIHTVSVHFKSNGRHFSMSKEDPTSKFVCFEISISARLTANGILLSEKVFKNLNSGIFCVRIVTKRILIESNFLEFPILKRIEHSQFTSLFKLYFLEI